VKAKVAALAKHFSPVIVVVTVWTVGLKPLLEACQASLDGLPLFGAVDDVHSAFARAENRRLPEKPSLSLFCQIGIGSSLKALASKGFGSSVVFVGQSFQAALRKHSKAGFTQFDRRGLYKARIALSD
jgi:hypothetical protein